VPSNSGSDARVHCCARSISGTSPFLLVPACRATARHQPARPQHSARQPDAHPLRCYSPTRPGRRHGVALAHLPTVLGRDMHDRRNPSSPVIAGCSHAWSMDPVQNRVFGHIHDRPDEEFHLWREQTWVTNLLDEVEHVVSSVSPSCAASRTTSSSSSRCGARDTSGRGPSRRWPLRSAGLASRASLSGICLDPAEIP
jgi:hypothetical protein